MHDVNLWPKWREKSLSFIAQINLSEIPVDAKTTPLPDEGILYFFYDAGQSTWGFDPKDKGSWAVIYSASIPEKTTNIGCPKDLPEHARYKRVPVKLQVGHTIPDPTDMLDKFSLSKEQDYQVSDVFYQFIECGEPHDQLLGHSVPVQGDMHLEVQLVSHGLYCGDSSGYNDPRRKELEAGASNWQLLLQIDTHDDAGMMWGDCGRLYFWITKDDLRNKRFENVWMILQCG